MIRAAAMCMILARCGAETYMGATGYWLQVEATAYSPLDAFTRDDVNNPGRRTADGTRTSRVPYGIAADPKILPYGTRIIIPTGWGYLDRAQPEARVFRVDDTGPIIVGLTQGTGVVHLDLRFVTVYSALRFGRKTMAVFIITEPL